MCDWGLHTRSGPQTQQSSKLVKWNWICLQYTSFLKINEYINLNKSKIQDYSKLEEAVEMLLEIKKQVDDIQILGRIQGYLDDVTQLGPIFRHVSNVVAFLHMCIYN